jgi:hypothetical protein
MGSLFGKESVKIFALWRQYNGREGVEKEKEKALLGREAGEGDTEVSILEYPAPLMQGGKFVFSLV